MLFDSSIRRELQRSFIGTLVVLLTVLLTMLLIRILGQATKGAFAPSDLSLVLSYTLIGQLPVMVALAVFVSVVSVLSRLWRESEMVVWQVSGASQFNFIPTLLKTAAPAILLVAFCTLIARPWAQEQTDQLKTRYEQRSDLARVAPGQFQTSADGTRVFFIDGHTDGLQAARNVFMVTTTEQQESVVTAQEGSLKVEDGVRYLILDRGERVQTNLENNETNLSRFETARIAVGDVKDIQLREPEARSMSSLDLLASSKTQHQGELTWRVGVIWATLNMVLVGLSLAAGNARRNSNWNLVYALLVFVVYFNLLSLSQAWVSHGKLSMPAAIMLIHGGLSLGALLLIWWRDGAYAPWLKVPRQPASTHAGSSQ